MKILSLSGLGLFVVSLIACSSPKGPSDVLKEANDVHLEAVGTYDEVHELYGKLKKEAKDLGDSLAIARLDSVHDVLHQWKDGLYEVPGFEHAHDHGSEGHSHDHDHKAAPSMTDQSMLEYQKNAKAAIDEILEFLDTNF